MQPAAFYNRELGVKALACSPSPGISLLVSLLDLRVRSVAQIDLRVSQFSLLDLRVRSVALLDLRVSQFTLLDLRVRSFALLDLRVCSLLCWI